MTTSGPPPSSQPMRPSRFQRSFSSSEGAFGPQPLQPRKWMRLTAVRSRLIMRTATDSLSARVSTTAWSPLSNEGKPRVAIVVPGWAMSTEL